MSVTNVSLVALALTLWGVSAVNAQRPPTSPYGVLDPDRLPEVPGGPSISVAPPATPGYALTPGGRPPTDPPMPPHALSSWILYNQPCCCGPLSNQQPLRYELYVRAGPAIPIGGGPLHETLETGWAIQGGARLLFFNQPQTAAWTADLSLLNIHNNGTRPELRFPIILNDLNPNPPPVVLSEPILMGIRSLNRTSVNLAGGYEYYLIGDGSCNGSAWRVGVDVGGSWGSGKVDFIGPARHRTDVFGRLFGAVHSDLEVPCGCCIFMGGLRAEWGYTWSDILQRQNNSDLEDILIMGTFGVRF